MVVVIACHRGRGGWCSLTPQERGVPAWPINGGRGMCAGCSLSWGRGLVQLVTLDGGFALLDSVPGLVFLPPFSFVITEREGRSGAKRLAGALWWSEGGTTGYAGLLCPLPTTPHHAAQLPAGYGPAPVCGPGDSCSRSQVSNCSFPAVAILQVP